MHSLYKSLDVPDYKVHRSSFGQKPSSCYKQLEPGQSPALTAKPVNLISVLVIINASKVF